MEIPSWTSNFAFGALIAAVAAGWGYIKDFGSRIVSLVVMNVTVESYAKWAVERYVWNNCRRSPNGFRKYTSRAEYVKPIARYQLVGFETVGERSVLFWRGFRPILVSKKTDAGSGQDVLHLTYIRGMFNADQLVADSLREYSKVAEGCDIGRYKIEKFVGSSNQKMLAMGKGSSGQGAQYDEGSPNSPNRSDSHERPVGYARSELGQESEGSASIQRMALTTELEEAITEAQLWLASKKWYDARSIPWRRGWLLHGKPGTGKTSIVRAVAQLLDIPLYVFDLGSMSNAEFHKFWSTARSGAPCVVLFEDFDGVFQGRKNVLAGKDGGLLTFDTVLNAVSGVESADGIFLMVTTNRLDCIDDALGLPKDGMSTRPGRLDRAFELKELDEKGRRKIASRILDPAAYAELIDSIVIAGEGDTGAQFQERCSNAALKLYWESLKQKEATK